MNMRHEILRAVQEAATVGASVPVGRRTSFDIVEAITRRNIPLLFRPLESLLGTVVVADGASGIMVTTKRDLHVQRFTLAHELGHVLLGHRLSLDRAIEVAGRNGSQSRPIQELAADTFASELLGSKQLVSSSAGRQGWKRRDLSQPPQIYQLSLRLGISFQAACWALVTCRLLASAEARVLQNQPVKEQKYALAPRSLISDPWSNVWVLKMADADTFVEAGPKDIFSVHVQDHASAGYLWQLVDSGTEAEVVDERLVSDSQSYGSHTSRILYIRFGSPGRHRLTFEHIRPWSGATLAEIELDIDGYGKEVGGFARRVKRRALASAA